MLARTFKSLRRRADASRTRGERGAIFLEALISIFLLISLSLVVWALATIIFNQAILNGSAQMAAHESIIVYDRGSYRDALNQTASDDAFGTATAIVNEDTRGLVGADNTPSSDASNLPDSADFELDCAPDFGATFQPCETSGGRVERATVTIDSTTTYRLFDTILGAVTPNELTQHATGYAYSSGPENH